MATSSFSPLLAPNLESGTYRAPPPPPPPVVPRHGLQNPFGLNPPNAGPHIAIPIAKSPEQIKAEELEDEKLFASNQFIRRVSGYPLLPQFYNKQTAKKRKSKRSSRRRSRSRSRSRR
jgi:hypothetical protein